MTLGYALVTIFTSEGARTHGKPVHVAVVEHVAKLGIAARSIVTRGVTGSYENGEIATGGIETLSFNMPLRIDIVLPRAELERVLPELQRLVEDGVIAVSDLNVAGHRARRRFIPPNLKVRDVMTPNPVTVGVNSALDAVLTCLLRRKFGGVPVVDAEGRPAGIITQGDLVTRAKLPVRVGLLATFDQEQRDDVLARFATLSAAEVMSKPAFTVREDDSLEKAVGEMLTRRFKRLPVVDEGGRLTGILARFDVFRAITSGDVDTRHLTGQDLTVTDARLVRDVVQRDTHTVAPDAPIADVIALIASNPIQRVAVVDASGTLLGLVTDRDVLEAFTEHRASLWELLARSIPFTEAARQHRDVNRAAHARTAAEVMKTALVTVHESDTVERAVTLMAQHGLKRLPVIDDTGRFAGMISRNALLRAGAA